MVVTLVRASRRMKQRVLILTVVLLVFTTLVGMGASRTPSGHFLSGHVLLASAAAEVVQTSASPAVPLIPFTLVSARFAVNFVAHPGNVRHTKVEAVSGSNRHIRLDLSFEHLDEIAHFGGRSNRNALPRAVHQDVRARAGRSAIED